MVGNFCPRVDLKGGGEEAVGEIPCFPGDPAAAPSLGSGPGRSSSRTILVRGRPATPGSGCVRTERLRAAAGRALPELGRGERGAPCAPQPRLGWNGCQQPPSPLTPLPGTHIYPDLGGGEDSAAATSFKRLFPSLLDGPVFSPAFQSRILLVIISLNFLNEIRTGCSEIRFRVCQPLPGRVRFCVSFFQANLGYILKNDPTFNSPPPALVG